MTVWKAFCFSKCPAFYFFKSLILSGYPPDTRGVSQGKFKRYKKLAGLYARQHPGGRELLK
jgi:hypothetical protein